MRWLPLLGAVARRIVARLPASVDRRDLVQAAAERMTRYGVGDDAPEAHVRRHAQHAMMDEVRRQSPLGRSTAQLLRQVEAAGLALCSEGVRPTPEAIAQRAGVSVRRVMAATHRLSLLAEDRCCVPVLTDEWEPHKVAETRQSYRMLRAAVERLPAHQRDVMLARLDGRVVSDTAQRLGITCDAIHKRERDARRRLRAMLHGLG